MSKPNTDPSDNIDWSKLAALSDEDKLKIRDKRLQDALEAQQKQLPALEAMSELVAKARFVNFQSLVKAGFTQDQALYLIANGK